MAYQSPAGHVRAKQSFAVSSRAKPGHQRCAWLCRAASQALPRHSSTQRGLAMVRNAWRSPAGRSGVWPSLAGLCSP
eukprot:1820831-Pyramimonas_sp.AAC.1